jgi:hypothetical protein
VKARVAALAPHRVQRARDTMHDAEALLATGRWTSALNRLYCASDLPCFVTSLNPLVAAAPAAQ